MQVLVTGAAGFVGSHLCEELVRRGHAVVGLDAFIDYYPRHFKQENISAVLGRPSFTFREADLRFADLEPIVEGCDVVVHAAAMPGLPRSWTDFDKYESCNLTGTQRLAEACRKTGVGKLVHISTSSVYGACAVGDEGMPTRPVSPYGVTKLAAEHLLLAYQETFGLPICILRYFSVYGPRQRPDMAYNIFAEAMLDERSITVFGDGHQSRSNTYIADCVAATVAAAEDGPVGEILNIGGGEVLNVLEAIDIIGGILGVRPRLEFVAARHGDQRQTAADISKARRLLGYSPAVSPADGLRTQVEWQRRRRQGRSTEPTWTRTVTVPSPDPN